MSPATSRPSTKKHCEPGVCPGVWMSVIGTAPTVTVSPDEWSTRSESDAPVTRFTPCASSACTCTFARHAVEREQLGDALDRPAAEVTAHVIGVVVRDEHVGEAQAVGGDDVDELAHAVRGIDRDRFAGLAVADDVHEVHHLLGDLVVGREVAPGEQLTEVQARRSRRAA